MLLQKLLDCLKMELVRVNARKHLLHGDYASVYICAIECIYNLGLLVGLEQSNLLKYDIHNTIVKITGYISKAPNPTSAIKICNLIDSIVSIN
jgi:hypothetical protein